MQLKEYSRLNFWTVELENSDSVPPFEIGCVRMSIPTDFPDKRELINKGFIMIDRTIDVKIPINGNKIDFQRFCRLTVLHEKGYGEEIRKIARASFGEDYRFKTSPYEQENKMYNRLIDVWLEGQQEVFVCFYKDKVIGFADVRCLEEYGGMPFIFSSSRRIAEPIVKLSAKSLFILYDIP